MRKVSLKDVYEMWRLQKKRYSYRKISEMTGFSKGTIVKYTLHHLGVPFSLCLASAFRDCSLMVNPKKMLKKLGELLRLEKNRRGVNKDKLVFIGMADVANLWWCARKSLLKNKEMELEFFGAYLRDRINYSFQLKGLSPIPNIDELPKNPSELLDVGNEITLEDVEKLLKKRSQILEFMRVETISIPFKRLSPTQWGKILEIRKAEQYPTIRWNFEWEDYVVVGEPDGITDTFVYEFKSTKNRFLMNFIKPVALTQADLYGYFFKRDKKKVQIHIIEENVTETWEEKVDKSRAIDTLRRFKNIDEEEKTLPPKKWKCRICEFKEICKA